MPAAHGACGSNFVRNIGGSGLMVGAMAPDLARCRSRTAQLRTGAVGLVTKFDAAKVALGPSLAGLVCTETLARTQCRRWWILLPVDPLQGGMGGQDLQKRAIHLMCRPGNNA